MAQRTCTIDNCTRRLSAVGMCATHYRNMRLYGRIEGAPDPVCQTCGSAFPRPGKGGTLPRYCSQDCDPRRKPRIQSCQNCGRDFDRGLTTRAYCSKGCLWRYHNNGKKPRQIQRPCARCGTPIDYNEVGEGGRLLKADTIKCRACRRPGSMPTSVAFLVERDGADCRLCGDPVDLALVWPHRMSATRDHIVPFALGGSNDASNLQLAHFSCNVRKGARLIA